MTVVDDIKSRLDILEVVSGYVSLQRSGRSYKANCPFHQERTPSFYVFPERQSWRCFGACATGGDVFSFVMRSENLDFAEALKRLSQQAGVALPQRERRGEQQTALSINEAARDYFRQLLGSTRGTGARAYLEQRGLNRDSIEKFELGLSPGDGESLKNHLTKQGFSPQQLAQAGVVRGGDDGRFRDLFRSRLIIPIRNAQGELGGFGSRALDDSKPKYLNSPRTPVFDKGRILYGLYLAKEPARQQGIVIVEGYMDAIMAHQHGFSNVVASMGTALTEDQVAQVRRITSNVTMALDPDAAGQQATLRSLESSWRIFQSQVVGQSRGATLFQRQETLDLKIAALPDGLDPDELIRRSADEWAGLVEKGVPLFEYLLPALSAQVDVATPQGKSRLVQLLFPLIAAVPEPTQQDHYFQLLAAHLGVGEETLRASVGRPTAPRRPQGRQRSAAPPERVAATSAFARLDRDPIEEYCLALLIQRPELMPELMDEAEGLTEEHFRRAENREMFKLLSRIEAETPGSATFESIEETIGQELAGHLESLTRKGLPPLDHQQRLAAFRDTARRLEERHLRELKAEEGIKFAEAPPGLLEDPCLEALDINERIKRNEDLRNRLTQSVSRRG